MASTAPNIDIDQRSNTNVNNVNVRSEKNITNYAIHCNTTISPDYAKNMESIRAWMYSGEGRRSKAIPEVDKVLETSMRSIEALTCGQLAEGMKGCLRIAGTIADVVGGPYSEIKGALCGNLGLVLSNGTPNESYLETAFIKKVDLELHKFNEKLQRQTFHGLAARLTSMISYLGKLKSATAEVDLPDKVLFETDFPQFIGEVSENFARGLSAGSKEKEVNDCLRSMVVYCYAQTLLLVLLAKVLVAFQVTGRQTMLIKTLLNGQKADAYQKLGVLSNSMILHLRRNPQVHEVVEKFREGFDMTKMPGSDVVISGTREISHLYPHPETRGDNHYFQLINHTDVPIKVVCDGVAGDYVNGMKFRKDVLPRSSYEHIATEFTWIFSTGGFFVIYLDGRMRSFENMFEDQRNLKVFEFALRYSLLTRVRKSALLEKTDNLPLVTGQDCWMQMSKKLMPIDIYRILFTHNNKFYVVSGGRNSIVDFGDIPAGRNGVTHGGL